jgi:hypothetical protein
VVVVVDSVVDVEVVVDVDVVVEEVVVGRAGFRFGAAAVEVERQPAATTRLTRSIIASAPRPLRFGTVRGPCDGCMSPVSTVMDPPGTLVHGE